MNDMSMFSLLISASFGVKIILIILSGMSILSWSIIFKKHLLIKDEIKKMNEFSDCFWRERNIMNVCKFFKNKKIGFIDETFNKSVKFFYSTKKNQNTPLNLINEIISGNFQVSLQRKEKTLNQNLSTLGTISSTAPYVGLLGTVYGILVAFWALGWETGASVSTIAPSIAEALVATGMGLFVAIPALIAYNYFSNKIDEIKKECMDIEDETINMINKTFVNKKVRVEDGQ